MPEPQVGRALSNGTKRVLIVLVTIGVVLGIWKGLGKGVSPLSDPGQWATNARLTLNEFGTWISHLGRDYTK